MEHYVGFLSWAFLLAEETPWGILDVFRCKLMNGSVDNIFCLVVGTQWTTLPPILVTELGCVTIENNGWMFTLIEWLALGQCYIWATSFMWEFCAGESIGYVCGMCFHGTFISRVLT